MRSLLPLSLALLAAACPRGAPPVASAPTSPSVVVVLHTNDTHGHIWEDDETGSAAQRATLVSRIRAEASARGAAVVLLDAGDVRTGSYCSDLRESEPDLAVMRAMGYDAMVLGNHEFDVPYETTLRQRSTMGFPLLGANVVAPDTGEPAFDPSVVLERGGLRIAVLGLVTDETPAISTLGARAPVRFEDPVAVARARVPELRRRADLVIVLSHLGLAEDRELAAAVPGIDLVVGGHSHSALDTPERVGGAIVAHAGAEGRFVGRVDLEVGPRGARMLRGELLPVGRDLPADREVAALLARYDCPEARDVVGRASAPITREELSGPGSSSALANLVGDALLAATGADVALLNRGGLRADIPAGEVTFGRVHAVLPFTNHLVVLEATGADLLAIARAVAARGPVGAGLLLPSGMDWVLDAAGAVTVTVQGRPVAVEETYRLVVGTFLASGGDRHAVFSGLRRIEELELSSRAALEAHVRRLGVVSPDAAVHLRWEEAASRAHPPRGAASSPEIAAPP